MCLSSSIEKCGISKSFGHCLLHKGDDPVVDRISSVLHSDAVVGEDREVNLRIKRGIIFIVALSGKSFIWVKLQRALLKSGFSYWSLKSYCNDSLFLSCLSLVS